MHFAPQFAFAFQKFLGHKTVVHQSAFGENVRASGDGLRADAVLVEFFVEGENRGLAHVPLFTLSST